jgi:CRISPR/Cas system-associated exonuclease Cas4 (RecB family)
MNLQITEKLIAEITKRRKEHLQSKIKRYRSANFRASNIGECDRQMVYSILEWDKSALYDEGLQAIFDRGNEEERLVVKELTELGFTFMHQQTPFEIKNRNGEVICVGHIDGKILYDNVGVPAEIKSMNMNTFNSIRSLEDFQKKPLHRKYLRQMQLYLYGNNAEAGIFILSDLQGHYKLIPVILDYGECEYILQRLERNWNAVKEKKLPDRIDYNEKICGKCAYSHICLKEFETDGARIIENKALEEKLNRREELEELVDEYDSLDSEVKDAFKNIPEVIIGADWRISGKEVITRRVDTKAIPDELKNQYIVETKSWKTSIIKL